MMKICTSKAQTINMNTLALNAKFLNIYLKFLRIPITFKYSKNYTYL